jgi:hypothetical protein
MGVEVVEHQPDLRRVGIVDIDQVADGVRPVELGAPRRDLQMAPAGQWLKEDERLATPRRSYSSSLRAAWPGATGTGPRVSPLSCLLISSMQTWG